jgi:hypothetical protein
MLNTTEEWQKKVTSKTGVGAGGWGVGEINKKKIEKKHYPSISCNVYDSIIDKQIRRKTVYLIMACSGAILSSVEVVTIQERIKTPMRSLVVLFSYSSSAPAW